MIIKKILFAFAAVLFIGNISAQETPAPAPPAPTYSKLPSISAAAGVLIFNGNIGQGNDLSSFSRIRAGYSVTIEERIGKILGVSIDGLFGKLAESERSKTSNRNFESSVMQGNLNIVLHTDRLFPNASLTPYIAVGAGLLSFNPYGDLKDKNGNKYYYWTDGSIRDRDQIPANNATAQYLQRDYVYETKLDSLGKYSHTTLVVPLTLGFNLKITDNLSAAIGATYYMTFTNNIDNVQSGKNDAYLFTNVSVTYTLGHGDRGPDEKRYESVDFSKIEDGDSDEDGVKDSKDKCAGTPKGVKVDSDGCPVDSDKDGVPDYMDKEPNSKKGALVDNNGVTITDEMLAKKQAEWDAAAEQRSEAFNANPTQESISEIEKKAQQNRKETGVQKSMPAEFQGADFNKDGFIQASEINQVIDGFFTGENDFTVERINRLIDYFFEQ